MLNRDEFIAILKTESDRLQTESRLAAEVYHKNRRKIKNRIKYENLIAQWAEINQICILLNISLDNDTGKLIN